MVMPEPSRMEEKPQVARSEEPAAFESNQPMHTVSRLGPVCWQSVCVLRRIGFFPTAGNCSRAVGCRSLALHWRQRRPFARPASGGGGLCVSVVALSLWYPSSQ